MAEPQRAVAGVRWWRSRRSAGFDVALALLAAGLHVLQMYVEMNVDEWLPPGAFEQLESDARWSFDPATVWMISSIGGVVGGLILVVRRRFPAAVAAALVLAQGYATLIGLYTLAAYGRSRRLLAAIGLAAAVVPSLLWTWVYSTLGWGWPAMPYGTYVAITAAATMPAVVAPILLGLFVRARRELFASLRERTARLERERHLLAERALVEERARIARELHDVVGHRVSLMVLHAGVLEVTAHKPERAAQTVSLIRSIGAQALDELQQIIALLQIGDDGSEMALAPQPTVEEVDALIAQFRALGMPVTYQLTGDRRPLGETVGRTTYRFVQEALTNAHKHAKGAPTDVSIRYRPDAIEVSVTNSGEPRGVEAGLPSGGHGLVGLRERVALLGGTFEAEPRIGGGFRVTAVLPAAESTPPLGATRLCLVEQAGIVRQNGCLHTVVQI